jgi:hypothetical protein
MTDDTTSGDVGGWRSRWQAAQIMPQGGGRYGLTLHAGATTAEVASVVGALPPAVYVDHSRVDRTGAAVTLVFRELPPGVPDPWRSGGPSGAAPESAVAVAAGAGWVPAVAAVADRGLTSYQVALAELIAAAPDGVSGARLLGLAGVTPEAVVILADLLRAWRRCSCHA